MNIDYLSAYKLQLLYFYNLCKKYSNHKIFIECIKK